MFEFEDLVCGNDAIAVVGLGYVGMPLAVAFARRYRVIGFDIDDAKIAQYRAGYDATREVGDEAIAQTQAEFTSDAARIREAGFVVIAVPTPINGDKTPDLTPVISASETVGRNLRPGAIVCYESTVYPGVTEQVCAPILERESGLVCGRDFKIAYSPERINPGDKVHTLTNIVKVVSGMDAETLGQVESVYGSIIDAGVFAVSSIMTAEAVKLVENSQRDINIAFMNEMSMVFERMGIDTNEVVDGMNTKWNALGFRPGLVGGHCIGVDPYYFVYEAERLGYTSQVVATGRRINDRMGIFAADMAIKRMVQAKLSPADAKVVILGITFKENCPDVRNTRVVDIVHRLRDYGIESIVVDPWADPATVKRELGIELTNLNDVADADCVIHAVAHREFSECGIEGIMDLYKCDVSNEHKVLIDIKGQWPREALDRMGVSWWRM